MPQSPRNWEYLKAWWQSTSHGRWTSAKAHCTTTSRQGTGPGKETCKREDVSLEMSATIIQMGTFGSSDKAAVRREAIAWIVRMTSGAATDEDRRQCAAWRAQSLEHDATFRRFEQTWDKVGGIAQPVSLQERKGARSIRHVPASRGIAWAVAASIVLVTLWNLQALNRMKSFMADHRTAVAEQRLVTLEDGSTLFLNTDTAINVELSSSKRKVRLLRGEVDVVVAPDARRPFDVFTPDLTATALGTDFVVKTIDGRTTVTVLEHAVRVQPNGQPAATAITVQPGQRAGLSPEGMLVVETVDPEQAIAWRHGKLIFDGHPLSQLIDELNRYRTSRIVLLNPSLGSHRVTGVFPVNDGDATIDLLKQALPVKITDLSPLLVLVR